MRTISTRLFLWITFLFTATASLAQTDSLYSLNANIASHKLKASFFTSAAISTINEVYIDVYDTNNQLIANFTAYKNANNELFSKTGEHKLQVQKNGHVKITIDEPLFEKIKDKSLRFEISVTSNGKRSNKLIYKNY